MTISTSSSGTVSAITSKPVIPISTFPSPTYDAMSAAGRKTRVICQTNCQLKRTSTDDMWWPANQWFEWERRVSVLQCLSTRHWFGFNCFVICVRMCSFRTAFNTHRHVHAVGKVKSFRPLVLQTYALEQFHALFIQPPFLGNCQEQVFRGDRGYFAMGSAWLPPVAHAPDLWLLT